MDWILDNLQLVIAIAAAIAYWLNARRKDHAGEPADYDGDGIPDNQQRRSMREADASAEQAENTRRIQEEIRRKIAERQMGGSLPPPPMPQPVQAGPSEWDRAQAENRERALRAQTAAARRVETERASAATLERQRALAEQLAALKAQKAEADRKTKAVWTDGSTATSRTRVPESVSLLAELRSAQSLRKAVILREVLGTPAGLR